MKKVLVTGGTGFIGSNIVKSLIKKKYHVSVYDNNSRGELINLNEFEGSFNFIEGDIRDKDKFINCSKGINTIFHLAYINGTKNFYSKPYEILEIATKGIVNVIDAMNVNNIDNLVLASSSEVYQEPQIIPTDENIALSLPDVFNPRLSYGGGKIISELMSINFARKFNKNLKIFRPHNVFGPKMGFDHVIPEFITKILSQQKKEEIDLEIQGSGNETRSFIYIDDFISGFECILDHGEDLNIYNIGTEEEVSINEIIIYLSKLISKKINVKNTEKKYGSTKRRCPNINKIKSLGFKNKYNLEEGIKKTYEFYKKEFEKSKL